MISIRADLVAERQILGVGGRGQNDDHKILERRVRLDHLQRFASVGTRSVQVQKHKCRADWLTALGVEDLNARVTSGDAAEFGGQTRFPDGLLHGVEILVRIFQGHHDRRQIGREPRHAGRSPASSVKKKVEPSPRVLSSHTRPPCRSMILRAMARPAPVPPPYSLGPWRRLNMAKTASLCRSAIPIPLSRTKIAGRSPAARSGATPISTLFCALSLYFSALVMRLTSTSRTQPRSLRTVGREPMTTSAPASATRGAAISTASAARAPKSTSEIDRSSRPTLERCKSDSMRLPMRSVRRISPSNR